jgi:hypothetical protein
MELVDLDAVNFVNSHATVRDGSLLALRISNLDSIPFAELFFEARHTEYYRFARLELRDVTQFEYCFSADNHPNEIQFMKFLKTNAGEFYLSLDPYDERDETISEKDNDVFRSKQVKLILSHSAKFGSK